MRFFFLIAIVLSTPALAENAIEVQKDEQGYPFMASLKANKANMRIGPGLKYPLRWIYQRKNLPIEVLASYGSWRKVRDYEGDEGWIWQKLLRKERYVIIRKKQTALALHSRPGPNARRRALLESGVIARLSHCKENWCQLSKGEVSGWAERKYLWGIYPWEWSGERQKN